MVNSAVRSKKDDISRKIPFLSLYCGKIRIWRNSTEGYLI